IVGRRLARERANRFLLAQGSVGEVPESQRVVNFLALHRGEKPRGEVEIGLFLTHQSELGARAFEPMTFVLFRKGVDHLSGARDGTVSISIDQRQKRLREARKVPLRDPWLVGVGIAAVSVDGAEDRCWIVMMHEGAWAVIERLNGARPFVGVSPARHDA